MSWRRSSGVFQHAGVLKRKQPRMLLPPQHSRNVNSSVQRSIHRVPHFKCLQIPSRQMCRMPPSALQIKLTDLQADYEPFWNQISPWNPINYNILQSILRVFNCHLPQSKCGSVSDLRRSAARCLAASSRQEKPRLTVNSSCWDTQNSPYSWTAVRTEYRNLSNTDKVCAHWSVQPSGTKSWQ